MKKIISMMVLSAVLAGMVFAQTYGYSPKTAEFTTDSYGNKYELDYLCDFDFPLEEFSDWSSDIFKGGSYSDTSGKYGPDRINPKANKATWKDATTENIRIKDGVMYSYTEYKWSPKNANGDRAITVQDAANFKSYCNYGGKNIPTNGYKFSKGAVLETKMKFEKNPSVSTKFSIQCALPCSTKFEGSSTATLNEKGYYINEIDFMELTWDGKNKVKPRGGMWIWDKEHNEIRQGCGWGPARNWQAIDTEVSTIKIDPATWFNEWHDVRVEWADENIKCYLDGVLYETISWDKKKYGDTTDDWQIQLGPEEEIVAFNLKMPEVGEDEKYSYCVDYIKVYKPVK